MAMTGFSTTHASSSCSSKSVVMASLVSEWDALYALWMAALRSAKRLFDWCDCISNQSPYALGFRGVADRAITKGVIHDVKTLGVCINIQYPARPCTFPANCCFACCFVRWHYRNRSRCLCQQQHQSYRPCLHHCPRFARRWSCEKHAA